MAPRTALWHRADGPAIVAIIGLVGGIHYAQPFLLGHPEGRSTWPNRKIGFPTTRSVATNGLGDSEKGDEEPDPRHNASCEVEELKLFRAKRVPGHGV